MRAHVYTRMATVATLVGWQETKWIAVYVSFQFFIVGEKDVHILHCLLLLTITNMWDRR